ncbi:hypothetical protein EMIT047CA2_120160 [Pseudomonas soli]
MDSYMAVIGPPSPFLNHRSRLGCVPCAVFSRRTFALTVCDTFAPLSVACTVKFADHSFVHLIPRPCPAGRPTRSAPQRDGNDQDPFPQSLVHRPAPGPGGRPGWSRRLLLLETGRRLPPCDRAAGQRPA